MCTYQQKLSYNTRLEWANKLSVFCLAGMGIVWSEALFNLLSRLLSQKDILDQNQKRKEDLRCSSLHQHCYITSIFSLTLRYSYWYNGVK